MAPRNNTETTEEICPAVAIVSSIVAFERARKLDDDALVGQAFEDYSRAFMTLFNYPPTSSNELNPTPVRIINKYGSLISKAIKALGRSVAAYVSASSLFKSGKNPKGSNKKITVSYFAPSQDTISRWTKNLIKENEGRDEESQKQEYIPSEPKEYHLNLISIQDQFTALAKHVELFTKMTVTFIRHGRSQNTPDTFKGNYTPFALGPELTRFFNHEKISSILEVTDENFVALHRDLDLNNPLPEEHYGKKLVAARNGTAMRRTIITALYIYARVKGLLKTMRSDKKKIVTGFILDDAMIDCFASGKNHLFSRLLSNGNAYAEVSVDFTSKERAFLDKLKSEDKSVANGIKELNKINKSVQFIPIFYVQKLISLGFNNDHETIVEGKKVKMPKISEEERAKTNGLSAQLLEDIEHIQLLKDVLDDPTVKQALLKNLVSA